MTEPNRSLPLGRPLTTWEDLPRWQRLTVFWGALALGVAFCIKSGQTESWSALVFAMLAGRLMPTLFDLTPKGR
jgi:hypothetical protein